MSEESGIEKPDLENVDITDPITGEPRSSSELRDKYDAQTLEKSLITPDRTNAMCKDLFKQLAQSGTPEQKTIVFCTNDHHADRVAATLNNIYADWCKQENKVPKSDFAFKCTAASNGNEYIPDLRGAATNHFIATTVTLLSTGVDVPPVVNIVFFQYIHSPISFYQMIGRGTRIHIPTNKLLFTVYDYTNARRLLGQQLLTTITSTDTGGKETDTSTPTKRDIKILQVEGITAYINTVGKYILSVNKDGKEEYIELEEYCANLGDTLVQSHPDIEQFRAVWVLPQERRVMMSTLPDGGKSPFVIRELTNMQEYDLYDIIAEIGYKIAPKTRHQRAEAFEYKNSLWLTAMNEQPANVIRAIAKQFEQDGTETLENPSIFDTPVVERAGGIGALRELGKLPKDALQETKIKIFSA